MTLEKILELQVLSAVVSRYGNVAPVRIDFVKGEMMSAVDVKVSVPGQHRVVSVSKQDLEHILDPNVLSRVSDEVLFAIYILLDEDEDEDE